MRLYVMRMQQHFAAAAESRALHDREHDARQRLECVEGLVAELRERARLLDRPNVPDALFASGTLACQGDSRPRSAPARPVGGVGRPGAGAAYADEACHPDVA